MTDCRRCGRGMHPQHKPRCPNCHQGRGLCLSCYVHEYQAGRIAQYPTTHARREKRDCPHGGKHKHGTTSAYDLDGCGCGPCRGAKREQNTKYVKRVYLNRGPLRVDATGTQRRIKALMRIGWSTAEIARAGGWATGAAVQHLLRHTWVSPATAAKARAVYDRLSMQTGPSKTTRTRAARKGWLPPLDWEVVDIDDPAATPPPAPDDRSSPDRRRARVDEYWDLRGMGHTDETIAAHWRLSRKSMERWLYRNIRTTEERAA